MKTILQPDSPYYLDQEQKRGFQATLIEDPFIRGRADRIAGRPCSSTDGRYLDGWYSLPNNFKPLKPYS